jgi:hypothetical protein
MHPTMTGAENALFRSLLPTTRHYVEFGCGDTTVLAAETVGETIIAVDSSRDWIDKVDRACPDKWRQFHHVDIGPEYHSTVWIDSHAPVADLFFIGGRFRVACFMQSLMRCRPDALLAIHDYDRPAYHVIERFARPVAQVERLAVFQRRDDWNEADAAKVLADHAAVPD